MIRSIIGHPSLAQAAYYTPKQHNLSDEVYSDSLAEIKLWNSVVIRAIHDFIYVRLCKLEPMRNRGTEYGSSSDARRWLFGDDCAEILEMIDLPREFLIRYVLKIETCKDRQWLYDQIKILV